MLNMYENIFKGKNIFCVILYTISYVIKIYLMTILYLIILQLKFYSNNNIDIGTNIGINIDILIVKM